MKKSNLKDHIIQNHPSARNSKSNLKLILKMQNILNKKSSLKKSLFDLIFIGNSGGISELLEKVLKFFIYVRIQNLRVTKAKFGKVLKLLKFQKIYSPINSKIKGI